MKNLSRFVLIVLLVSCTSKKDLNKNAPNSLSTAEIVSTLASDQFQGRKPGTQGIEEASQFIESYLSMHGIKPFFQNSYRDTLIVWGDTCFNIVGLIESENSKDEYIVIGAHLDHLGVDSYSHPDSIYNGANDNASGVSAVLKIAEELNKYQFDKKIIVALFTAEEMGLQGSRHLAQRLKDDSVHIAYMINFEMIGVPLTSSPGNAYISGYSRSNFAQVANEQMGSEFIVYDRIDTDYGLFRMSDNYPFYQIHSIPAHTICTFDFKNFTYMHDVGDNSDQLDIKHMELVIEKSTKLIVKLLENNVGIVLN